MPNLINVSDFDLAATLECGQAFRWKLGAEGWFQGVVGHEIWRLRQERDVLMWETPPPHLRPLPRRAGGTPVADDAAAHVDDPGGTNAARARGWSRSPW